MGNLTVTTHVQVASVTRTASQASRTYAAGELIVAFCSYDGPTNGTPATGTIANTGTAQTWVRLTRANGQQNSTPFNGGCVDIYACVSTGFTGTITATNVLTTGGIATSIALARFVSSGTAFSATVANNFGTTFPTFSFLATTTAFTLSLTTTAANSWIWGQCLNFTTSATATANGSSAILSQGDDGDGDQAVTYADTSVSAQPTVGSGTARTIGVTFAAAAVGQGALVEVLDPGGGGSFSGSATTTVALTATAAGVVNRSTGATPTLSLTGVAAGAAGTSGGATATLALAGVAAGNTGLSTGATAALALTAAAAGVVGTSSGATAATVTLGTVAAGVVGTSSGATATLTLTGTGSSGLSGSATTTLSLAGVAAGVVGKSTGATTPLALAGVAAGTVGLSSGATATLTLTGVAASGQPSSGATTTVALTATAAGVVGGVAAAPLTPDRPDWTKEDTASIVFIETKTIGPFEQVLFGLIGVGSYTIGTHTDTANQGIRLLLSYQATEDPNSGIALAVLTAAPSPNSPQYVGYESPSYGGQLSIFNQDLTQSYVVTVWSSNRVVTTPRYLGDLLPARIFIWPSGFTAGLSVFLPPADYNTFGYNANVLTGIAIDSTDSGTLFFEYLAAAGPPQRIPVATVIGGTPQLVTVPLPLCQGNFWFTPSSTNGAGRITVQAFPARS